MLLPLARFAGGKCPMAFLLMCQALGSATCVSSDSPLEISVGGGGEKALVWGEPRIVDLGK